MASRLLNRGWREREREREGEKESEGERERVKTHTHSNLNRPWHTERGPLNVNGRRRDTV